MSDIVSRFQKTERALHPIHKCQTCRLPDIDAINELLQAFDRNELPSASATFPQMAAFLAREVGYPFKADALRKHFLNCVKNGEKSS